LLSDIINQNLAIPKKLNDENAFVVLDALWKGVELYLNVLDFILGSYDTLARHFNAKMELDSVNKYLTLSEIRFREYLISVNGGLIDHVLKVLKQVQASGFVNESQKKSLQKSFSQIETIQTNLASNRLLINFRNQVPNSITAKPIFVPQGSPVVIGNWKSGTEVSYAVQYSDKNSLTRISAFSKKFVLSNGMNNPTITLPIAPSSVEERLIYRKFGNNQPEYIGSVLGSKAATFKDLNCDLFNAAGISNEDVGLPQVEALLKMGANASAIFDLGKTSYHVAAEQNNNKILALMVKDPKNLRQFDLFGRHPIHIAAEVGNVEAVETLAKLGADINVLNFYNLNALQIASMNGQVSVIRYLLGRDNIELTVKGNKTFPPLHLAVIAGHSEAVNELLLSPKVDINVKDNENFTALHRGITSNVSEIFQALMANPSVDVNIPASSGLTALHLAAIEGKEAFVEELLKHSKGNPLSETETRCQFHQHCMFKFL